MMAILYMVLGLACFAALLGLTQAVAHTEPRE
jgi:hypothetical protein